MTNQTHKIYDAYKETGIDWLGEIPEEWELKKLKFITRMTTGWTPSTSNQSYFDGDHDWVSISDMTADRIAETSKKISDEAINDSGMTPAPAGSVLYSFKLSVGKVAIAQKDVYTNEAIAAFTPGKEVKPQFLYYALSDYLIENATENIYGAKIMNQKILKDSSIGLPPQEEQKQIANFLDEKTERVDDLRQMNEKLIEALKEYKQALISHTVTKGLDPDADMKETDIDWFGEIPEKWEVKKFKFLSRLSKGKNPDSTTTGKESENSLPYMSMDYLRGNDECDFAEPVSKSVLAQDGDILLLWDGSKSGEFVKSKKGIISSTMALVEPKDIEKTYFWYLSKTIQPHVQDMTIGMGIPHVNPQFLNSIQVPKPTEKEQKQIAHFLDEKTVIIDEQLEKLHNINMKLDEYKQSLISNTVTGKIKV